MSKSNQSVFSNYIEIPTRIPIWFWWLPRILGLLFSFYLVYLLVFKPELGLTVFWKLVIPVLPAIFAFIPGLWRTLCPMAFLNQLPRHLKWTKGHTLPSHWKKNAFLISILSFFIVPIRLVKTMHFSARLSV